MADIIDLDKRRRTKEAPCRDREPKTFGQWVWRTKIRPTLPFWILIGAATLIYFFTEAWP